MPDGLSQSTATSSATGRTRIAVIGAGISGLAAAHRVVEASAEVDLVVFEARDRVGGALWTIHEDGLQIEQGVDNFITTLPWGLSLCRRLGIDDQLVQTNPEFRRTFVVRGGRLYKMPDGFLMMAPTRMVPLALTPLLSIPGKIRCAMEYFLPRSKSEDDESIAHFVRRRLGREAFDRLVEPLVSAVYAGDLDKLSIDATVSRFREMERDHGSIIRAMWRGIRERKKKAKAAARQAKLKGQQIETAETSKRPAGSGANFSMFVTLREGMSSMVDAIVARLPEGSIRSRTKVERLQRTGAQWTITTDAGEEEVFDGVVLATPSYITGQLLRPTDAELADWLGSIEHSGSVVMTAAYDREQVGHPLDGLGIVVPKTENTPILAISLSSQKYPHRAPADRTVFRVFGGGTRWPDVVEMDEAVLREKLLADLARLLHIQGEPSYVRIARWPANMPQYHVGHLALVEKIETRVREIDGLEVIGNALHGVGIPDCVHTAEDAVDRLLG